MSKNLTEGNSLKIILLFAFPLLLGNLFQQTYNIVDTAIVGKILGPNALAGVGCTSSVQFMILGFCIGLCTGFTIPIAQNFGANNISNTRKYFFVSSLTLIILGSLITILCVVLCPLILRILKVTQDIYSDAYKYLLVIFIGIPFSLLYNFLASVLRAIGDSKNPFYFLLISTILNIVLDLYFIISLKLGVMGAALATVISQAISGFLCLIFIIKKYQILHFQRDDKRFDFMKCKIVLNMGIPMGLQFSITAIGSMVLQSANNALGSTYVSSFTAATKLKQLLMCPYDALGTSVSTYASQNFGAGKYNNIKTGIIQGTMVSFVYGIGASLILYFFGGFLSGIFIDSENIKILSDAEYYSRLMGYFFWSLAILNVLRPTVQGLGFSKVAIFSGVIEMFTRCTVAFCFVNKYKFTAVCAADPSAWISAVIYIIFVTIYCLRKIKKSCREV